MEVSSLPRPGGGIQPRSPRLLSAFGDERLVEQLRRGNDAAFEAMYDRHHRGILSFCRHMLRSQEEAEDAVQQTFISAYGDLRGSDKEIRLKPWLYAIARNRCLSVLRARREQPAELDDIPVAGFSEEVAQRDDLRRLLADMRELPEDQRAALVLSELGDLSHSEIAGIVECDTMKVKSLVFQARSSLIESREAREIPCEKIREQLSTLTGGALRRGPLRRHLRSCPGCSEFRDQVRRQRQMVACLLPVLPSVGLKQGILAAAGIGGPGAGGAAIAAAGSGGGIVSGIGASTAAKLGVVAVLATGVVGGTAAIEHATDAGGAPPGQSAQTRDVINTAVPAEDSERGRLSGVSAGSASVGAALPKASNGRHPAGGSARGHHGKHPHGSASHGSADRHASPAAGAHGHARGRARKAPHTNRGRHLALGHRPQGQHPTHPPRQATPPPPPPAESTDDSGKVKKHGASTGGLHLGDLHQVAPRAPAP
ncbi:MAG: hypothetical protein QOD53_2198 [Thermoleophilaceae bacterium]|nr:hypothetical protein [Thermoleophilaceae bacterium]